MFNVYTILSTFLSGSFVGLLVKEAIGLYSEKRKHQREVYKMLFARKLERSEEAIAYFGNYALYVSRIANGLEIMARALKERSFHKDFSHIQIDINVSEKKVIQMHNDYFYKISSISLYFNIGEYLVSLSAFENFVDTLQRIKSFDQEMNLRRNGMLFAYYYEMNLKKDDAFQQKLESVIEDIASIIGTIKTDASNCNEAVKKIRESINSLK